MLIKMDNQLPSERNAPDFYAERSYKTYPRSVLPSHARDNYDKIDWSNGKPCAEYKKGKTSKGYNA